jgi:outer membrane lipoprotein-sorting protein
MSRVQSIVVGAAMAAFAQMAAAQQLSAAQVVEKNVAARGGLSAWRAVNSLTLSGEMEAGGKQNPKLPFVMNMKRPNKSRLEITFQGKAAVQVYDGTQGWKFRPFLNRDDIEPFNALEAKQAAAAAELDGPLVDYQRKGTQVQLAGTELVEGKKTYKLKLTPRTGDPIHVWVDASTFLEAKIDGDPRKLDGKAHQVAVFYRDFKTVNGLVIPHTLETTVDGVKQTHKMTIQSVKVNAALDDTLFAKSGVKVAKASGK